MKVGEQRSGELAIIIGRHSLFCIAASQNFKLRRLGGRYNLATELHTTIVIGRPKLHLLLLYSSQYSQSMLRSPSCYFDFSMSQQSNRDTPATKSSYPSIPDGIGKLYVIKCTLVPFRISTHDRYRLQRKQAVFLR